MKQKLLILLTLIMSQNMFSQNTRNAEEAKGLTIGSVAPLFKALDADSNEFNLSEALTKGSVVLIFYRGFWCPICNKHLGQIQDSLKLITDSGATVIAISPEKPEYLENKISDAYDVTFTPSGSTLLLYNTALGAKLKETHSDDSQRLPIPATYIISKEGTIVWRQFDPNYKNRSTVDEILKNLPN